MRLPLVLALLAALAAPATGLAHPAAQPPVAHAPAPSGGVPVPAGDAETGGVPAPPAAARRPALASPAAPAPAPVAAPPSGARAAQEPPEDGGGDGDGEGEVVIPVPPDDVPAARGGSRASMRERLPETGARPLAFALAGLALVACGAAARRARA